MPPGLRCPAVGLSGKFLGGSCARVFRERRVMPRFVPWPSGRGVTSSFGCSYSPGQPLRRGRMASSYGGDDE